MSLNSVCVMIRFIDVSGQEAKQGKGGPRRPKSLIEANRHAQGRMLAYGFVVESKEAEKSGRVLVQALCNSSNQSTRGGAILHLFPHISSVFF